MNEIDLLTQISGQLDEIRDIAYCAAIVVVFCLGFIGGNR